MRRTRKSVVYFCLRGISLFRNPNRFVCSRTAATRVEKESFTGCGAFDLFELQISESLTIFSGFVNLPRREDDMIIQSFDQSKS